MKARGETLGLHKLLLLVFILVGRGRSSPDLLSALVRGYPVVTEPLQLVGFKQGSGKILCVSQITLASGLEDGYAGGKTVGRETG